jgi:hypothetical protein
VSFLTIGGNAIPVGAHTTPDRKKEEIGDRARAVDGTMRETIIARKRVWVVQSPPITRAASDALEAIVETAPPLVVNGDLVGNVNVNCFGQCSKWNAQASNNAHMVILEITLMEA